GPFSSFGIFPSGILATAEVGSSGKAGNVIVQAGHLKITAGGEISSSTFAIGDGGTVNVTAGSLLIDGADSGVFCAAELGSSGRGGNVFVSSGDLSLQDEGTSAASS